MTEPVKIELTLQMDEHLSRFRGYDIDGEAVEHPVTLEDVVIREAALQLVERAKQDKDHLYRGLSQRVREIRDEEIRKAILPAIEEALTGPIQQTNTFGEGRPGDTTTLRELIFAEAKKALTATSVRADLARKNESPVQKIIREAVGRTIDKELKEAIGEARATVVRAVREKAEGIMAATIADMAGVRK